jgi:hypothetical protein
VLYPLSYSVEDASRIRTCDLRIKEVTLIYATGDKFKNANRILKSLGQGTSNYGLCGFEPHRLRDLPEVSVIYATGWLSRGNKQLWIVVVYQSK